MTSETALNVVEALLFAASEPLDEATITAHLALGSVGEGADVPALLDDLKAQYQSRGVRLVETGGKWSLRTAPELAGYLKMETVRPVKISRVAAEVLAVIAYHEPVTRAEIEAIRGVATAKETLEKLLETGWVRMGPRRETPGQPVTWLTTPAFLDHFGLSSLKDLPGMNELKAAGLLNAQAPITYGVAKGDEETIIPRADDEAAEEPTENAAEPEYRAASKDEGDTSEAEPAEELEKA
jgi:segregation and condensation protein B